MQPKLACYPRHPRKIITHVTYASTPPTRARHPRKHATQATHASTPPTPLTLEHHSRKHATHATHASTNRTLFLKLGNSLLYLQKYFINQNSNYIFMIGKD